MRGLEMVKWDSEEDYWCDGCDSIVADWDEVVERIYRGQEYLFCCAECAEEAIYAWMDDEHISRYEEEDYEYVYGDTYNPCDFRDPGGNSALRNGPRIYPCPNCGEPNMLTPADKAHGYQCDACADQLERGW
jgi:hypothetical protein